MAKINGFQLRPFPVPLTVNSQDGPQGALDGFRLQRLSQFLLRAPYARQGMSPPSASVDCAIVPKAKGKFSVLDYCHILYILDRLSRSKSSASI